MDETSSTSGVAAAPVTSAAPGIFGTKIPSAVAFGVGILLFFMPFLDIKCNTMILQKVSGVQLATGFKIKGPGSDNSLVGSFEKMNDRDRNTNVKTEKRDPNIIALVALCLGVAGFVLSVSNLKTGGLIAGVLAAVALIATMIDVKSKLNTELSGSREAHPSDDRSYADNFLIAVDFTPWFYLAVITFGVAAYFCYRWQRGK